MAIISVEDAVHCGVLIDGRVDTKKIQKLYYAKNPSEAGYEDRIDVMFIEAVYDAIGSNLRKLQKDKGEKVRGGNYDDLWSLNYECMDKWKIPYAIVAIYDEYLREKKKENYRQVLMIHQDKDHETMKTGLIASLNELNFDIKKKQEYKNYNRFHESCENLLKEMIKIFDAPCIAATERLEGMGIQQQQP